MLSFQFSAFSADAINFYNNFLTNDIEKNIKHQIYTEWSKLTKNIKIFRDGLQSLSYENKMCIKLLDAISKEKLHQNLMHDLEIYETYYIKDDESSIPLSESTIKLYTDYAKTQIEYHSQKNYEIKKYQTKLYEILKIIDNFIAAAQEDKNEIKSNETKE